MQPSRLAAAALALMAVAWAIPARAQQPQTVPPSGGLQPPPVAQPMPSCPEMASALTALVRNDARLRDWANLARYRQANAGVPKPAAGEDRVVFMGDSITDLWQQPRFGFFPGKPYLDRGISGQTTPQMLVRFRPDVIQLQPKAVVILAGTNDIAGNTGPETDEEIEGNLASMGELAAAHGIRVVLASILPVSQYHQRPQDPAPQTTVRPMSRIRALNDWMKQYAASKGFVYLDYFSAMVDARGLLKEELSGDDLHPNEKGYAVMTPLAEAAIREALRK